MDDVIIRKLRCECEAYGAEASTLVRQRLDHVARTQLPGALAQCIGLAIPEDLLGSDASIRIPRLDVELDIDVDADPSLIARDWAKALVLGLADATARDELTVFHTPEDRLAEFLNFLVDGTAWESDYWRDFEGIKPLPLDRGLSAVLQRSLEQSRIALGKLRPSARALAITKLGQKEARRILQLCAPDTDIPASQTSLCDFVECVRSVVQQAPVQAQSDASRLCLFMFVTDETAKAAIRTLGAARAEYIVARMIFEPRPDHLSRKNSQEEAETVHTYTPRNAEIAEIERLLRVHGQSEGYRSISAWAHGAEFECEFITPFGGAFLLAPHIHALPGEVCSEIALAIASRALNVPQAVLAADPVVMTAFNSWTEDQYTDLPQPALDWNSWAKAEGADDFHWQGFEQSDKQALVAKPHGYWISVKSFDAAGAVPKGLIERAEWDAVMQSEEADEIGLAAQIVLRRFAYRIPGFSASSLHYLRDNFLGMEATATHEAQSLLVRLGPAPLAVMLNMTGIARQQYDLPNGLTVRLSVREDA